MSRRLPLVLLAACCLAPPAPAQTAGLVLRWPGHPGASHDFVVLASDRPVLLRVHVRVHGRPAPAAWDEYMRKLFAWFDRNHDGVLSRAEVERAPGVNFLTNHLRGAIGFPIRGQTLRLAEVDADRDGKVSPAEFAAFYGRSNLGAVSVSFASNEATTDAVTATLYRLLDVDHDGRLSEREWPDAPALLHRLDSNEDEVFTADELLPERGDPAGVFAVPVAPRMPAAPRSSVVLEVKPGAPADGTARLLLARYDKDNDGSLDRAESGLDAETFAALDADRDGRLSAGELAGWLRRAPDLEFTARLGKPATGDGVTGFVLRTVGEGMGMAGVQPLRLEQVKGPRPAAIAVHRADAQTLTLTLGDAGLELYAAAEAQPPVRNSRQFHLQQFRMADTAKKGILDRKQAMAVFFIGEMFELADRDGDGKLTEQELAAWFDLQEEGAGSMAVLTVTDHGRGLFELIDADGDGRLSVRELRGAWARLKPYARDGAGLARADVPRRLQLTLGLSQAAFVNRRPAARPAAQAPLWFRKMDRNGDGDLSPQEFLGSAEEFARLDRDGDGLISAEEARQAEVRRKKN
jgi:Ca2+-binding EF-hand superfamily protein